MQRLQDSVFSIVKTTNLSPAVFSYLQPSEDFPDKTPLGGILRDTKHGWLALGPKFCVVDLRTGLKVASRTFGTALSNYRTTVASVVELPTPLTNNSQQLIISLECEDIAGMICVFHINGSQILRCIQTEVVVTELAICDGVADGPFTCFDGIIMAGTKTGEVFVFDLNRASLIQALKDISQGYEHMVRSEENAASITFLPLNAVNRIEGQRDLALENDDHIAVLLNETSMVEGQYIFRNPDGTVRVKAKRNHIRVTVVHFIPQLGSLAVGFNFGAFQIWNLMNLDLEFTSQVNVECLAVTRFGFQEPCDDPRAFCYLWVVFSVIDRFEEEEFPLAVLYSLTYQGKRMLSDTKCLYQEFLTATVRFQVELSTTDVDAQLVGGRCVSCHTYSVNSTLGEEGEDSMLNICQLVWECWGENANSSGQHGMLLFDLDQWYKDQMPATYQLQSNAFMSVTCCAELARGSCVTLDVRLCPATVSVYSAPSRLEEHFYPNSLHYNCICLNTSEACVLNTIGIQRQIINSMDEVGPTALLNPTRLYGACVATGLAPLYQEILRSPTQEEQRGYLLSVALEARLSRFLKRCAHDWATGSHGGVGCTLTFLVDWCWKRAVELKENARELTAPLFTSSALPDKNVIRCLEHCVQQLTQLTGLLDAVLTQCCNLVVPDALSEMEERYKGIGTVSLYFQVVQWFLRCGLLPERHDALPYPAGQLTNTYSKRRVKLHRLQDHSQVEDNSANKSCSLLYIDQLIEQEFGGDRTHQMWIRGGSECNGLYPPPSLYSLLRLYLLPDIAEEHKHSLVLYLLVDYSMVYDEVRYEAVIRRLMQFPTMFGLSNTAIKATQAFWHLDHRDFDFALDQLQCLTGNTLSEWQHSVVLSSLLAQKKTQAALQYLHVRKPAPQSAGGVTTGVGVGLGVECDKLWDWRSCCELYVARGLVCAALDVVRACVQDAASTQDQLHVLNIFFKDCRNTGQLSKLLQASLSHFEEEALIKYLVSCNEPQTSDLLIMYYLQQSRYLEAEQYNNTIKQAKPRSKEVAGSVESLMEVMDREGARDALVEVVCESLPAITSRVAHYAMDKDFESHVIAAKPMSVFIQAQSPRNTFIYKSSFIQDTIENASETWINKPKMKRGIKRALNIEDTPFICTPKLAKTKSIFSEQTTEGTSPKRSRLDLSGTRRTPRESSAVRVSDKLSRQMETLLAMPEIQSPDLKLYDRTGAGTPHSILKIRSRQGMLRDAPSPVDSRYLGESDADDDLETASNHTHYSDSTNKHLRFTIPTASESGSTPSPTTAPTYAHREEKEREPTEYTLKEKEMDVSVESFATTESHAMHTNMIANHDDPNPLESPPKKMATEEKVFRKTFKHSVRARRSLSISENSSLSEDPNTSIESIADIPITLINPCYSGERRTEMKATASATEEKGEEMNIRYIGDKTEMDDTIVTGEEKGEEKNLRYIGDKTEMDDTIVTGEEKGEEKNLRYIGDKMEMDDTIVTGEEKGEEKNLRYIGDKIEMDDTIVTGEEKGEEKNLRYIGDKIEMDDTIVTGEEKGEEMVDRKEVPTPKGRRGLRSVGAESTPLTNRSRSITPDCQDSPVVTPLRPIGMTRSRSRTLEISSRSSPLVVIPDQPKQEVESEEHPVKTTLSVPRQRRSRSHTPERVEKVIESPRLVAITESPTKSDSPPSSPVRRSLRNRSRTPEIEVIAESSGQQSPRSFRSRAKTPEKIMSPKKEHPKSAKKSLSRIVLEANAFAKTKQTLEKLGTECETQSESIIECTPMKALKPVPSLMDVTISPIANKSILQSSTESALCESVSKEPKSTDTTQSGMKSLPAFTMNESRFDKSVLHSYESSVADVSIVEDDKIEERVYNVDREVKSIPAFTLSESYFEKSVLKSYQSSIAESTYEGKETIFSSKIKLKPTSGSTTLNITDFDKSVLANYQSSSAETSQDVSKTKDFESSYKNVSSLMTSDSDIADIEMKEWTEKTDIQASVIQREKERIVEIEREINEIEGDMSEDSDVGAEIGSSDEVGEEEEDSEEEDSEETEDSVDDDIISIIDSDSDSSSSSERLQIDEQDTQKETQTLPIITTEKAVEMAEVDMDAEEVNKDVESNVDPLNQAHNSLMTDDSSIKLEQSDVLNYSDEGKAGRDAEKVLETATEPKKPEVQIEVTIDNIETTETKLLEQTEQIVPEITPTEDNKAVKDLKPIEVQKTVAEGKTVKQEQTDLKTTADTKTKDTEESEEGKPRTRKRVQSTISYSSNKPTVEETGLKSESKTEEPITPKTRKRSQSNASNTSITKMEKTPENTETTHSRRAKTPTPEVRKILTRRASKEISEKTDDSQISLDESALTTPKRRSTRSRSKHIDDNASIASESSVKSTRSKASEDADVKPVRKGRKSVLPTKPDLSVIPESAVEESKGDASETLMNEYSSSRRLTRNQKSLLESWLEPKPSPRRRASAASRSSAISEHSHEEADDADADASSTHSAAFDVQPIDRITLMNKEDFEGSPDPSELQSNVSPPDSIASDASKQRRRLRIGRAASETKSTPKAARITRRISVDVGQETSDRGSPVGVDSPARGRRASFNRACEALHTPKGRRTSTDVRKGETDSQQGSPVPSESEISVTPSRRPRRASTQSNASATSKADTARKSKKTSAVEESKDTKKK